MRKQTRTRLAAVTFAVLILASCGQKPGVEQLSSGVSGFGVPGQSGAGGAVDENGQPIEGATEDGAAADGAVGSNPGSTGSAGSGPGSTGSGTGATGAQKQGGKSEQPKASGDNVGDVITIGLHAPVTGASPFPQNGFKRGAGVFADYINAKGGINGRKVRIIFADDEFRPTKAKEVCSNMVEQKKVFLLVGGGGSDQIDQCARYAASKGVPYLSAGVHETRPNQAPLNSLSTFYALSLSYEQQIPMLSRIVTSQFKDKNVAVAVARNDSLNGFHAKSLAAMEKAGAEVVWGKGNERLPKEADASVSAIATTICNRMGPTGGVVLWNAAPVVLIQAAKSMPCTNNGLVKFIGPGNTNGLNVVAQNACNDIDGAQFFSTAPQLDKIGQVDPNFIPAYKKKNNGAAPDDIGILLWGVEKLVGEMLKATGKDLSRKSFMAAANSGKTFQSGVFPPVSYGANKRLGGTAMHLLEADCGSQQYKTKQMNVRP
ncbi:MAG: ABC transporter substrate-binding protein [Actinophytocola sp.]|nr:ABC transporter substrate-binding protein [Actinophytocola sp.]